MLKWLSLLDTPLLQCILHELGVASASPSHFFESYFPNSHALYNLSSPFSTFARQTIGFLKSNQQWLPHTSRRPLKVLLCRNCIPSHASPYNPHTLPQALKGGVFFFLLLNKPKFPSISKHRVFPWAANRSIPSSTSEKTHRWNCTLSNK